MYCVLIFVRVVGRKYLWRKKERESKVKMLTSKFDFADLKKKFKYFSK